MIKKTLVALLFLLTPCIAHAQSQVSIALGAGYAGGTVVVTTVNPNGSTAPVRSTFLDGNGASVLSWLPTGAKNIVTVCKIDNTSCLGTVAQPTGNVQDITSALQANPVGGGAGGSFGPNYSIGGGTAQAQTVAPTTAITNGTLVTGYQICWLPNAANSGPAPTLAGSGSSTFSAKPITKYGTIALVANDIVTTAVACVEYDGTEFQLQMPIAGNIARTSYQAVGAAAQALNLYTSGGCDGVSACTGNFTGFQAPASVAASLQWTLPIIDGSAGQALRTDGAQHLSWVTNTGITNFNQAAQSQVVVSGTEYYITRSDLDMPTTYITPIGAGTTMHWRIALNKTAAGTGTFQILLKKGTAGSIADTSIVTQTIGTQTAAADNMECDIQLTFTSATAAYWTIIPRQSAASATGFGLVYPAVAAQFNGTISGQTTTTASDKYGLSVIFTTGTPTFIVTEVSAQAYGVN